jgi:hypothetical protein
MKEYSKSELYKIIVTKTGRPDYLAIELYLDIVSQIKKHKLLFLKTSYAYFSKKHTYSKEQIRRKLVCLESLNLIQRSFTDEVLPSGSKITNILTLSLLDGGRV